MRSVPIADLGAFEQWSKTLPGNCLVDRDAFLLSLARGKSVVHLGAANSPYHKQDAERGEMLHQKLQPVAGRLVGIDSDAEAVAWLREHHQIQNIRAADVCSPVLDLGKFDLILCCDIIEHVSDTASLLRGIKPLMNGDSRLVVTTINALSMKPALRALLGREAVHPDHVSYYSFSTLGSLLLRHGFRPVEYATFAYGTVSRLTGAACAAMYRIAPSLADGILIIAQL
ncbi:MAG: methyltransferase domain-containing protein [Terriglobia bacterium]|jgi:hypothetical protein